MTEQSPPQVHFHFAENDLDILRAAGWDVVYNWRKPSMSPELGDSLQTWYAIHSATGKIKRMSFHAIDELFDPSNKSDAAQNALALLCKPLIEKDEDTQ